MRIAIFCETELWGGLEAHAVALAEFLAASGQDVSIVCLSRTAYDLYRRAAPRAVVLDQATPPRPRSPWGWWRALRHVNADAAILEKGTLRTGGLALDCVLKAKYGRYLTIQQLEPPELPPRTRRRHLGGLVPGLGLWWYRWKWSGYARSLAPDLTICVSDAVRERLAADYGFSRRKLVTVHNGVDPAAFAPNPDLRRQVRREWGVPENATVFGSVSRLSPQKGLDIAVDAFARVVRHHPERLLYLVMVGEGTERSMLLDKAASLNIAGRVVLPGFTTTPRSSYLGLDFFLIPSRYEGLPFSLLEAMASGCPVIGTSVGGIPEVVTGNSMGTLVPPEDPARLADAMRTALQSDTAARANQREAARARVTADFNIRAQCGRIASMLSPTQPRRLFARAAPVSKA